MDAGDALYTEGCNSAFKILLSSSSATPLGHQQRSDSGTIAFHHAWRPRSLHSLDAHPIHQSPEDFQLAIQTQSAGIAEASGLLLTDSTYINYELPHLAVSDWDGETIVTEHEEISQGNSDESRSTRIDDPGEAANAARARLDLVGECLEWGSDPKFSNLKKPFAPGLTKAAVESVYGFPLKALKSLGVGPCEDAALQYEGEMTRNLKSRTTLITTDLIPKAPKMRTSGHRNLEDDTIRACQYTWRKVFECPEQETVPTTPKEKAMIRSTTRMASKALLGRIRRRSKIDELKHARQILTDEQRRQNHSRSEKRRRILINDYLDDLHAVVPCLARGKFGKSAVLELAREWIQELIEGNKTLGKQLSVLAGKTPKLI